MGWKLFLSVVYNSVAINLKLSRSIVKVKSNNRFLKGNNETRRAKKSYLARRASRPVTIRTELNLNVKTYVFATNV